MSRWKLQKPWQKFGNPNSVSDAGVGAIAALAGVKGAYLNVKINTADLEDKVCGGNYCKREKFARKSCSYAKRYSGYCRSKNVINFWGLLCLSYF